MSANESVRINTYQRPVDLIDIASRGQAQAAPSGPEKSTFKEMFSDELAQAHNITFSKHAHQRLHSRGIELGEEQMNRLADGMERAQGQSSKETLVLTEDAAFVVSVPNRTVITVFDRDNLREGVVTHIDSAVIV